MHRIRRHHDVLLLLFFIGHGRRRLSEREESMILLVKECRSFRDGTAAASFARLHRCGSSRSLLVVLDSANIVHVVGRRRTISTVLFHRSSSFRKNIHPWIALLRVGSMKRRRNRGHYYLEAVENGIVSSVSTTRGGGEPKCEGFEIDDDSSSSLSD